MRQRALLSVLLVHAIEQTDLAGDALSHEDRMLASSEAADGRALPAAAQAPAQIDRDSERFLARRAEGLLARLRVRSPGVDRILAAAAGPTGLDGAILLLGFAAGVAISFADGTRIDVFAYPLIALILWNLVVYVVLITRAWSPAARDGFLRRWFARVYANRVRARIETLIIHSIGFNAPLAPGLRRFAADWSEVARPVFRERARRLLHLAAILAALGLAAGYGIRGGILRQPAGWGASVFGPASAHAALVTLYGAASAVARVPVPSSHDMQALAWTSLTSGGGPAGPWLILIACTALLYVVLPRLLAVIITTLALWRRSATLRSPPSFDAYLAAVLRASPTAPAPAPQPPPLR